MTGFFERLAAEDALLELSIRDPQLAGLSDIKVIRAKSQSISAQAKLDGTQVFIKQFRGDDAAEIVSAAHAELTHVAARLDATDHRVNRCIAAYPEIGLVILEHVPGQRLDHAIRAANPDTRDVLLRQAGCWLQAYASGRVETASNFSPGWWIKKRAEPRTTLSHSDMALWHQMLEELRARARELRGTEVTKAATHGDFVSINAHLYDDRIYGVDIQGKAVLPLALDVARFLVWTECQTPSAPRSEEASFGIARRDWTAFLSSGVLSEDEALSHLPFFLGLQMLGRLEDFQEDPVALDRLRIAIRRYLNG